MKLGIASRIAVEVLAGNCTREAAAKISGVEEATIGRYISQLKKSAHLSFGPPLLDIALSSIGAKAKLNVVQVGANDGSSGDPVYHLIRRYADKALLVEPQPGFANRIESTYADFDGKLIVETVAVSPNDDILTLYCLRKEALETFNKLGGIDGTQLASFNKDLITKRVSRDMKISLDAAEGMIEAMRCESTRVSELATKHGFDQIDFLQVDCEGFDFQVIRTLDQFRPSVINFESVHLSRADWQAWKDWSLERGYGYIQGWKDCIAILGLDARLDWR